MIYTSSYDKCLSNKYRTYSISGDRGKSVNYKGNVFSALAPKKEFWQIWHNNIGKLDYDINNKYYIEEYYKHVLSKLNPEQVYNELDNSILLCYEKNIEFCHRHIVAAWFELSLGVVIPEVIIENDIIKEVYRQKYIKYYLENYLKENDNKVLLKK